MIAPGLTGKIHLFKTAQIVLLDQASMHIGHAGCDILAELKLVAALAISTLAQLTGPGIDILEQMPVDAPASGRGRIGSFRTPFGDPGFVTNFTLDLLHWMGSRISSLFLRVWGAG